MKKFNQAWVNGGRNFDYLKLAKCLISINEISAGSALNIPMGIMLLEAVIKQPKDKATASPKKRVNTFTQKGVRSIKIS